MKQRNVLQRLRVVCMFVGSLGAFLLLPQLAGAQSISQKPTLPTTTQVNTVNWKSSAQALVLIEQRIELIASQLSNSTPGTVAHLQALARKDYFKLIANSILNGDSVASAVTIANRHSETLRTVPGQQSLYTEAVQLLGN